MSLAESLPLPAPGRLSHYPAQMTKERAHKETHKEGHNETHKETRSIHPDSG